MKVNEVGIRFEEGDTVRMDLVDPNDRLANNAEPYVFFRVGQFRIHGDLSAIEAVVDQLAHGIALAKHPADEKVLAFVRERLEGPEPAA